ncbi:hypothetical protein XELAEV_18020217mg [Xenopus laevis]|uniref:C3H1-type domain-containing protein n=1 Tax=Xenopus laevis TaxID=8355 RepID=A0A974D9A1_XENLA|nr:hypothetical protein XELAEV_18020217mg [Xenopus laevis]
MTEDGKLCDSLRWVQAEAGHEDIQALLKQCQQAASPGCLHVLLQPVPEAPGSPSEEAASSSDPRYDIKNQRTPGASSVRRRIIPARTASRSGNQPVKKKMKTTLASITRKRIQAAPPQVGIWPSTSPPFGAMPATVASGEMLHKKGCGALGPLICQTQAKRGCWRITCVHDVNARAAAGDGDTSPMCACICAEERSKQTKQSDPEMDRCRPVARTFSNWLQVFCIYANVLSEKYPQLGQGLFKRIDIILEAYGGISWFLYDDKFREKMSIQRSIPWGSKDIDLWMGMLIPKKPQYPVPGNKAPTKYNAFWALNESVCRFQANCRYKHECAHCAGNPPAFQCVKRFISARSSGKDPKLIQEYGQGAMLAKSDIQSAFRLLPIYPDCYKLLGFHSEGKFYFDRCLPMGCSLSCFYFEAFASFFCKGLFSGKDDFLFVGPSGSSSCGILLCNYVTWFAKKFGIPLAADKTISPPEVCNLHSELPYILLGVNFDCQRTN